MDAEAIGNLLTIDEVREQLRCSRRKIYLLAGEGRLELVKFDRGTRVTERSLRRLLRSIEDKPWSKENGHSGT